MGEKETAAVLLKPCKVRRLRQGVSNDKVEGDDGEDERDQERETVGRAVGIDRKREERARAKDCEWARQPEDVWLPATRNGNCKNELSI